MARPLHKTYNPDAPYVLERHDDEDGAISYEIYDYRPDTYRRICRVSELSADWEDDERGQAKRDAELIVAALNAYPPAKEPKP